MKLIVVICTYNRSALLQRTLARLCEISKPQAALFEVIVVNNCCTDDTDSVVLSYADRLPINLIHESTPGLSSARNCGVREAERRGADYVLWTDDDVLPGKNWLTAYEDAFQRYPEAVVFGGVVDPWFEVNPPRWLLEAWSSVSSAYAVREISHIESTFHQNSTELPYGANFCVRMSHQKTARYDANLGVIGNKRLGGEETVLIRQILGQGATGRWIPEATVQHFLGKERLTRRFLWNYFTGLGETLVGLGEKKSATLFGYPRWLLSAVLKHALLLAVTYPVRSAAEWAPHFRTLAIHVGALRCHGATRRQHAYAKACS